MVLLTSKFLYLFIGLSFLFYLGSGQVWLTEQDRRAYGIQGAPLTVIWKFDAQGKEILHASWQVLKDNNEPQSTLVSVNALGTITQYKPSEVKSPSLGHINFIKLDKDKFRKIKVSIEFKGGVASFTDQLTIEYVEFAPSFNEHLPYPLLRVIENSDESRNRELKVKVQGKPRPNLVWKLNNVIINNSTEGFSILESKKDVLDGQVEVESKLKINELNEKHNGILTVAAFYGVNDLLSPIGMDNMTIDVQFPPRNATLTTNITNLEIVDSGFVGLTCQTYANPPAMYTITESSEVVYNGHQIKSTVYLQNYRHASYAIFVCRANNTLGSTLANTIEIQVLNSTVISRRFDKDESNWWIYYVVAVGIACVIFIGLSATVIVIRSCILRRPRDNPDGIR